MALREIVLELGVEVDKADIDNVTSSLDTLKKAALSIGAVFATGALAIGYQKLIDLASAAAETQNKFNAVFEGASENVQKQLDETTKRTGIAGNTLRKYAADIGAVIKPSLGSADAAGEMSASVAELALHIASFNDVEPSEALAAMRSGLIGSFEPLIKFGADTRVAVLQTEALSQGITKSVKSMSEGEKVQLRFAVIMKQLGVQGALGDAERTANDYANAVRGLTSQLEELGAFLGSFLLVDAAKTIVVYRDIVSGINEWLSVNEAIIRQRVDDVLQVINNTIKGIVLSVRFVIGGFQKLGEVIGPVASGILLAIGAIVALVAILGAPVVAVLALAALIGLIIDDLVVWAEGGESLFGFLLKGIKDFLGEFEEVGPAFESLMQSLTDLFDLFFGETEETSSDFVDSMIKIFSSIWDDVIAIWLPVLDSFFTTALEKISEFAQEGIEKAAILFEGLAKTIASGLERIFGGTIGRILIDFLGAKAGAVVGEFMGQLVGKLAGKIAGKGVIGKAISSKIGETVFGLLGKGAGAIVGGLKADELALGLQEFINAPAAISGAGAGGGFSMVNQPKTEIKVEVDARGQPDPQAIADVTAQQIDANTSRQYRQSAEGFKVMLGAT